MSDKSAPPNVSTIGIDLGKNTVHFNLVVVSNNATLGGPTIHQTAAQTSVVSSEFRVEALMPFIVARTVVSLLRRRVHTKKHGGRAAEQRDELAPCNVTCHAPPSETCPVKQYYIDIRSFASVGC